MPTIEVPGTLINAWILSGLYMARHSTLEKIPKRQRRQKLKVLNAKEAGRFRSLTGYAKESLAIGRALTCGYNLFFKAWRDSPYDAVLDANGTLFRVEIKGTSREYFTFTSGGRSGEQIFGESREKIITPADCDFVIGIDSATTCYIVPAEVIELINRKTIMLDSLTDFREKWGLFAGVKARPMRVDITSDELKLGFRKMNQRGLAAASKEWGVEKTAGSRYPLPRMRLEISGKKERSILDIWRRIASFA